MRLKTFCGCLPLKAGVIIVGSFSLIWALASIIFVSGAVGVMSESHGREADWRIFRLVQVGFIVYVVLVAAAGALMIHGARKREPGFVFPWLARCTADLLLIAAAAFTHIIVSPTMMDIHEYFVFLAAMFIAIAFHVYIWLVVYSFYKQITVEKYRCTGSCSEEKMSKQPFDVYHHF